MPATYGALQIPVPVADDDDPSPGDPALNILLGYWKAFLNFHGGAAWADLAPVESGLVKRALPNDPTERNFNDNDLPALFLWREGSGPPAVDLSEDVRLVSDTLVMFYVLPPAQQEKQSRRLNFAANVIPKMIDDAVERNGDAAFILNPATATERELAEGTRIMRAAGLFTLDFLTWRRLPNIVIGMWPPDGGKPRTYQGLELRFAVTEQLQRSSDDGTYPAKLALDVLVRVCPELATHGVIGDRGEQTFTLEDYLFSSALYNGAYSGAFSPAFDGCPTTDGAYSTEFGDDFDGGAGGTSSSVLWSDASGPVLWSDGSAVEWSS